MPLHIQYVCVTHWQLFYTQLKRSLYELKEKMVSAVFDAVALGSQ